VAGQLGIAGEGELRPEQKLERIRHLAAEGRCVLMAGDGVNDAPALREADVGVAVGSGTAAARGQAGIELVGDDLAALAALIRGARALRRTVRANFAWTLLYNALLLSWAASGRLDPLAAAVAMIVSSLIVSVRSYRLLDWTPDAARPGPADARPDALPGESARGPERHAAWAATGGAPR
jgi:Cu+-exporting ATPase